MEIPKAIGPFELRRAIGHGTYGHVFEGFDSKREIRAAVKLYGEVPKGEAAFARLRRDAQAAGALGHPNIATVIAVGEHEGAPWVATELVPGVSLLQVMSSRTIWPIERVLDVWRQLCEGLAHAHREGLLHLDLKPSDIRISADGDVKVVDFGAWHVRPQERRRSAPAGESLHYRPPEVLAGERPDRRADIFAIGAVIYELVMRRKAFPGESTVDVIRSLAKCAPDLATLPSSPFSPGFERVLAASLERLPDSRPSSFEDVHADLVQLVRDTAPRLREPTETSEFPPEREGFLADLTRARAEDRFEDAMDVCRKLLALDPDDPTARRALSDVESVILSREADDLVGQALTLAADGDIDRATRLAEKVERLAPWSPRYLELQVYLDEEGARRKADELVAAAEAHQSDSTPASGPLTPSDALRAATADWTQIPLVPELSDPVPESGPFPDPAVPDTPEARAEALTGDALRHFTANDHRRALELVEKALELDPANPRARGLQRILRVLG